MSTLTTLPAYTPSSSPPSKFFYAVKDYQSYANERHHCRNRHHDFKDYLDVKADETLYLNVKQETTELPFTSVLKEGWYQIIPAYCFNMPDNSYSRVFRDMGHVVLLHSYEFDMLPYSKNDYIKVDKLQTLIPVIEADMITLDMLLYQQYLGPVTDNRKLHSNYGCWLMMLLRSVFDSNIERQEKAYLEAVKIYEAFQDRVEFIFKQVFHMIRKSSSHAICKMFEYLISTGFTIDKLDWWSYTADNSLNYLLDHRFVAEHNITNVVSGSNMKAYFLDGFSLGISWKNTITRIAQHPQISKLIFIPMLSTIVRDFDSAENLNRALTWFVTKIYPLLNLTDDQRQLYRQYMTMLKNENITITFNKVYVNDTIPDAFTIEYPRSETLQSIINTL